MNKNSLLQIKDLYVKFSNGIDDVFAVNGINLDVKQGEILGIVGESGCGKSVSLFSILRLLPQSAKIRGEIIYKGKNLVESTPKELQDIRGKEISMIFQEPMSSLNPVLTIQEQLIETIVRHNKIGRKEAKNRALQMLEMVEIPNADRRLKAYPYQLSGGMRQRVMIAMALSCRPHILLADEPTTALDVTIQSQIIALLKRFNEEDKMSIVIVSHDIGVISDIASRVLVFYAGKIIEEANTSELLNNAQHPYAKGLLSCIPSINTSGDRLYVIKGMVADITKEIQGCPFYPRCEHARPICEQITPVLEEVSENHKVACHLVKRKENV